MKGMNIYMLATYLNLLYRVSQLLLKHTLHASANACATFNCDWLLPVPKPLQAQLGARSSVIV
jgi:hypothetical protein